MIGSLDLNRDREVAPGDGDIFFHAVEVLDAGPEHGIAVGRIGDLGFSASGEGKAFWGEFVHEVLLGGGEEGPGEGKDFAVADFAGLGGLVAGHMDEELAFRLSDGGEVFGGKDADEGVDTGNPLFDRVVPAGKFQFATEYELGQAGGGGGGGVRIPVAAGENEVAEEFFSTNDDPFLRSVINVGHPFDEMGGKYFLQPFLFDRGGEGEDDLHAAAAVSDFVDFRRDQELAVLGGAASGELSPASVDDVANQGPLAPAAGDLIGKPCEDASGDGVLGGWGWLLSGLEAFGGGNFQKLFKEFFHLAGGLGMNGERAEGIDPEAEMAGMGKGLHEEKEVRSSGPEGFRPEFLHLAVGTEEKVAGLGEGGNEGGGADAA